MKTNRELDELIYKLLHNVEEIPPPQEYVDFSSRSVEYVDQVPNYTGSVDNALTLLGNLSFQCKSYGKRYEGNLSYRCYIEEEEGGSWLLRHYGSSETLAMSICMAWLAYKGYPDARNS